MSDFLATAAEGLKSAAERFETSAKRTVSDKNADLPAELVAQKMAEIDFMANLKVIETARKMTARTLDILV